MKPLKTLPAGEYFKRTPTALKVFVKGAYSRSAKAYECHAFGDVNRLLYIKGDKLVHSGFTF